jgi:hypothetical protein
MSEVSVLEAVELRPVLELVPGKFSTRERQLPDGSGREKPWKEAIAYRQPDWKMLWIGHPWLSVRFDRERLLLSEPHESDSPLAKGSISPEELGRAVTAAEDELEDFARRMEPVLHEMGVAEVRRNARRLAGLEE